jgi:hypothetical protein
MSIRPTGPKIAAGPLIGRRAVDSLKRAVAMSQVIAAHARRSSQGGEIMYVTCWPTEHKPFRRLHILHSNDTFVVRSIISRTRMQKEYH